MPEDPTTAGRSRLRTGLDTAEFDRTDRILLGACAAVWLIALGAGVAATVALVDLGNGHAQSTGESDTPWLLYVVIAISAVVIIGAVPLLLRARRAALEEPPPRARAPMRAAPAAPARGAEAPTEKIRIGATTSAGLSYPTREAIRPQPNPLAAAVDQLWLRCAVVIAIAMGVAMVAIGIATYLMAVDHNAVAWALYILAGIVTLGMPAIPWFYLRELRALLAQ
ncbi:Protein of unknown function (DUF2561) [Mycobacterium sp. JS623]|uniref:DUF2561 family protein n=1 Tax=Mycobacterium sp. JS623 TaxID=212767 RepID=UPI0002A5B363|nr:DUF2561 family protein [Mycobacterium sp. JS623]AGB24163.1 Protein of unknown function (DUF2561) [Mycobacterium sp. JS623]